MSQAPLILFVHVPKTAGMSFRQWLGDFFSGNVLFHQQVSPIHQATDDDLIQDRGYIVPGATACDLRGYFDQYGAAGFDRYQAIGGHFTFDFPFVAAIERPVLVCAAVRDPLERIVSFYNWVRLNKHNPLHSDVQGRTLFQSLRKRGPFYRSTINQQLNFIFGKKRGFLTKRRPNSRWTLVVRHDRCDLLAERIADMFGKPVGKFPHRNRVRSPYKREVFSQPDFSEAERLIRKTNAEEFAFVDSVQSLKELNHPSEKYE